MHENTEGEKSKKSRLEIIENPNYNHEDTETLKRIDKEYILSEVSSVLNFDRGILYTIKELLLRPGNTAKEFLLFDRKKLVKPIFFIVFSSLVFIVSQQILGFNTGKSPQNMESPGIQKVFEWVEKNFGIVNIIWGFFVGFWARLFFFKSSFNIYEIFILIFFVIGFGNLIYTFFGIIESTTGFESNNFTFLVTLSYSTWAIGNFFNKKKIMSYFKGFFSYIFGITTGTFLFILIGILVDIFNENS